MPPESSTAQTEPGSDRRRRRGRWWLILVGGVAVGVGLSWGVPWLLSKQRTRNEIANTLGRPTLPFHGTARPLRPLADADLTRANINVALQNVADGFYSITDVQFVPGSPDVMVVAAKNGHCEWVDLRRQTRGRLFTLDIPQDGELGLLGLAFHPDFAASGQLYVHHSTHREGGFGTRIALWHVTRGADGTLQSAAEQSVLLELDQPYTNHNGGQIAFGPDGFLYIGLGDGGDGGDPHGHGQNLGSLLGKILRIDVNGRDPGRAYAIPADNPFLSVSGARPELWTYGVRNPWRFTFEQGRLVIADVGQDLWEEISFAEAGDNLGWNQREANTCFKQPSPGTACERDDMREPFYVYGRDEGRSITGGVVYTGEAIPELRQKYIFGDVISGKLWALKLPLHSAQQVASNQAFSLGQFSILPVTFARDHRGEVYVADLGQGAVYRFTQPLSDEN